LRRVSPSRAARSKHGKRVGPAPIGRETKNAAPRSIADLRRRQSYQSPGRGDDAANPRAGAAGPAPVVPEKARAGAASPGAALQRLSLPNANRPPEHIEIRCSPHFRAGKLTGYELNLRRSSSTS